jgi:hypothetical protein
VKPLQNKSLTFVISGRTSNGEKKTQEGTVGDCYEVYDGSKKQDWASLKFDVTQLKAN